MKKSLFVLFTLAACIFIFGGLIVYLPANSAAVEEETQPLERYVNEEKGYSIEYPKNWHKQDMPRLDIVLLSPPQSSAPQARATMNIVSETLEGDITLNQFYNSSVQHLTNELKEIKVENSGDLNIHGIPSKWIEYSHKMMETNFRVLQYFLVVKNNIFLMTFSAVSEDFDHFLPIYKNIAASFKELPQRIN